jgi:cytosine/adenosine deaminase-related metal-dependent hydrolase
MKPAATIIVNALVFDGTGADPVQADVLVREGRIAAVGDSLSRSDAGDAQLVDGAGATLIPGLIDGHAHLGFGSTTDHLSDRREAVEERTLLIAHAGEVLLDSGFTSAYSGGNRLPAAEVAARKAFGEGWLPGPRLRACSWEGSVGMLEPGQYSFPGVDDRAPDPAGVSRFVHEMADLGVDIVKLSLSGESAVVHGSSRVLQFTESEVAAAAAAAAERGVWLTAHAHSAEAIKPRSPTPKRSTPSRRHATAFSSLLLPASSGLIFMTSPIRPRRAWRSARRPRASRWSPPSSRPEECG